MPDRLKGKVAVVTGAAPRGEGVGNGMACAILFAREGAKVVLVNRDGGRAEALAGQIAQEGGEAAVFAGDVTRPAAAEAMADFAVERYGRLDVLHNNVGWGAPGTAETVKLEDWHRVLDANLTSAMLCSKFAIPKMRVGGGGSIIMVSSILGAIGLSGNTGRVGRVCDGEGRVVRAHVLAAADYAAENIRANWIVIVLGAHADGGAPGRRRPRAPAPDGADPNRGHRVGHRAWRRVFASDEARWVTGIQLPIDGGVTHIRPRPL